MILLYLILLISVPVSLLYSIIGLLKTPNKWKIYLVLIAISISVVAFNYNPTVEGDLTRYMKWADECSKLKFSQVSAYFREGSNFDSNLVVTITFFWIMGKIHFLHGIPMITTTVAYLITFYITGDFLEREGKSSLIKWIYLFQFCMIPFVSVINNVRNITAFSLIVLAVYLDVYRKKRNIFILILYIAPLFIHSSAAIMIFLRVCLILPRKLKWFFLALVFAFPTVITYLYEHVSIIPRIGNATSSIVGLINKGYTYLTDTNSSKWAQQVSNSAFQQINKVVMLAFCLIVVVSVLGGFVKNESNNLNKYCEFIALVAIYSLACGWITTPQYWRFTFAVVVGISPILCSFIDMSHYSYRSTFVIVLFVFIFALTGLILQLWNNRISVDYVDWFENVIINNFYVILLEFFKSILVW